MAHVEITPPVSRTVTLLLTEAEATALYSLLRQVGGDPNTTFRGDLSSISYALNSHLEEINPWVRDFDKTLYVQAKTPNSRIR